MSTSITALQQQANKLKSVNIASLSKDGNKVSGNDLKNAGIQNTASIFSGVSGPQKMGVADAQAQVDKKLEDIQAQSKEQQTKEKGEKADKAGDKQQGQKKLDLVG